MHNRMHSEITFVIRVCTPGITDNEALLAGVITNNHHCMAVSGIPSVLGCGHLQMQSAGFQQAKCLHAEDEWITLIKAIDELVKQVVP